MIEFDFEAPELDQDYKTITYDEIKKRLVKFKEKDIVLKKYENKLNDLRKVRNRMEHYINDYNEDDLLNIYNYAIPFINDYLELELDESAELLFENWDDFIEIEELARSREEIVKEYIEENQISGRDFSKGAEYKAVSKCTVCGRETIESEDGVLYCKFCGNRDEYHRCSVCYEVFPVDGWETFHDEIGMCDNCFMDILDRSK